MSHDISQTQVHSAAGNASRHPRALLSDVSVIIPVGPDEMAWQSLVSDLTDAGAEAELLLIGAHAEPAEFHQLIVRNDVPSHIRWRATSTGRARQMNYGAQLSTRPFVWFLHADSRVSRDALLALARSLEAHPDAIHYFDLAFQDDGPKLVRLNSLGAQFRSRYLRLPFGDQGLCMNRDTFQRLGRFDESAAYGEDHLLVWAAHRHRVPLRRVAASITTSARKYCANGWLAATLLHGWRTWRQATPQFLRFLRGRCG